MGDPEESTEDCLAGLLGDNRANMLASLLGECDDDDVEVLEL